MRKNRILEILAAAAIIIAVAAILKADKGCYTEITSQAGYLGSVTVFNADDEAVYKWYSASGYILSADVSKNGRYLAVACEKDGQSKVHIFRTDSTDEAGLFTADEVVVEVGYLDNRLCALTEHGVYVLSRRGNVKKHVKLDGYLGDYEFDGDTLTVYVQSHMSGGYIKTLEFD